MPGRLARWQGDLQTKTAPCACGWAGMKRNAPGPWCCDGVAVALRACVPACLPACVPACLRAADLPQPTSPSRGARASTCDLSCAQVNPRFWLMGRLSGQAKPHASRPGSIPAGPRPRIKWHRAARTLCIWARPTGPVPLGPSHRGPSHRPLPPALEPQPSSGDDDAGGSSPCCCQVPCHDGCTCAHAASALALFNQPPARIRSKDPAESVCGGMPVPASPPGCGRVGGLACL